MYELEMKKKQKESQLFSKQTSIRDAQYSWNMMVYADTSVYKLQ